MSHDVHTATSASATLRNLASLVKLSHSVFALPFALIALFVATNGRPGWLLLLQIVGAVVAARTAAMAFNRVVDRRLDAANPRTADREIPSGAVSLRTARLVVAVSSGVFVGIAWSLGPMCFWLSWPVLLILLGYSYGKRFTSAVHLWLGIALGLAPPAAWLAARAGVLDASILPALGLGIGVSLWVAGFDVLYSCQDAGYDREVGLHSIPSRFGVPRALWIARGLHVLAVAGFIAFGVGSGRGTAYWVGGAAVLGLLAYEHYLLRGGDLKRIGTAFFTMNGLVSLALLAGTILDLELHRL